MSQTNCPLRLLGLTHDLCKFGRKKIFCETHLVGYQIKGIDERILNK